MAYPDFVDVINPSSTGTPLSPPTISLTTRQYTDTGLAMKIDILSGATTGNVPFINGTTGMLTDSGMAGPAFGFMSTVPTAIPGRLAFFEPGGMGQVGPSSLSEQDIVNIQTNITQIQNDLTVLNTQITNITQPGGQIDQIINDITNIQGDITNIQNDITTLANGKMDKVPTAVSGNVATFNNTGQVIDSGSPPVTQTILGNYLPLAGGTMTGDILMNNGLKIEAIGNADTDVGLYFYPNEINLQATALHVGSPFVSAYLQAVNIAGNSNSGVQVETDPASGHHSRASIFAEDDLGNCEIEIFINDRQADPQMRLQGVKISNLTDPVWKYDAVHKKYIDDIDSNITQGLLPLKADKVYPPAPPVGAIAGLDSGGNLIISSVNETDITTITNNIANLQLQINSMQGLGGNFLGTVQNETDIPTFTLPPTAAVNDFVHVQVDNAHGGSSTYYVLTSLSPVTWVYGGTYSTGATGFMALVTPAVNNHILATDAAGQAIDSGFTGNSWVHSVPTAVSNHVAVWNGAGQQLDGGININDLATLTALQGEATARQNADAALQSQLTLLNTAITTETADRIAADTILQTNINNVITAYQAADAVIIADLTQEVTDRQTAVTTVQTNLTNHINDASKHITATDRANWDGKATAVPVAVDNIATGSGTFIKDSGIAISHVVLSEVPTTINRVALYTTQAAALTASTANPTWLCFFPE